jgi:hypothetical protein
LPNPKHILASKGGRTMEKCELLDNLQEENLQWEAFLDQIGLPRMETPGVNGAWSIKDMLAHLTGWNRWLVIRMQAASKGEPPPLPPWPADLENDDDINAWLYEINHRRSLRDVLDESRLVLQQLLVWIGGQRFEAGEFFDHFHDDHEPDVRAWIKRESGGK